MSYAIPLPARPRLDFYKKLAKELLHAASNTSADDSDRRCCARVGSAVAGEFWLVPRSDAVGLCLLRRGQPVAAACGVDRARWRELRKKKGAAPPLLADAQFFLAREHGFLSWPKFAEQVRALENAQSPVANFEAAVDAIVAGDEVALGALLAQRSCAGEGAFLARASFDSAALLLGKWGRGFSAEDTREHCRDRADAVGCGCGGECGVGGVWRRLDSADADGDERPSGARGSADSVDGVAAGSGRGDGCGKKQRCGCLPAEWTRPGGGVSCREGSAAGSGRCGGCGRAACA